MRLDVQQGPSRQMHSDWALDSMFRILDRIPFQGNLNCAVCPMRLISKFRDSELP